MARRRETKDTHWGMPIDVWRTAVAQAEAAVVQRARERGTITYADLCGSIAAAPFKPYSWKLMALLDEVCRRQDGESGIVLATLVVRADTGRPGEGYFTAFARLGADVSDREALWRTEAERVWSAYSDGPATAR